MGKDKVFSIFFISQYLSHGETVEKRSILFKVKEEENFHHGKP